MKLTAKAIYVPVLVAGLITNSTLVKETSGEQYQEIIPQEQTYYQDFNTINHITNYLVRLEVEKKIKENKQKQYLEEKIKQQEKEIERINSRNDFINYIFNSSKIQIANNFDLTEPSNLSEEEADKLLEETGLEGLGKYFVEAEKEYGVNALYLMSHAAWESGWGSSKIYKTKNNLFGYQAYDDSPGESARKFETPSEGIMIVAKYIKDHYLNEDGQFYNGKNLKGMNIKYASDENWSEGIASVMKTIIKKTEIL
jgi:Beta- N-acetylglucosaminidase